MQLRGFSSTNLQAIATDDIQALTTKQVAQLSTSNLASLTTDQVQALTTAQIKVLTSTQLRGFTSTNLQAIQTDDIQALTTTQVYQLSTAALQQLSTVQFAAMTTTQLMALNKATTSLSSLTTNQTAGLDSCQIGALFIGVADPLILDLNDDGVHLVAPGWGPTFTVGGQKQAIGWVGAGDGMLVTNKDFGPNTLEALYGLLPTGFSAVNGPTGLVAMDKNRDGVINANDAAYKSLEVYTVTDGVGKLQTLSELNIASIAVSMTATHEINNGNLIGLMGSFTTGDGVTHSMADAFFSMMPVVDLERAIRNTDALVDTGHVDLTKVQTFKNLNVRLEDVLSVGENLSGVHQLTIDGSASDTVHLADSGSGWHAAGTTTDGADSYMVYVNANAQLLVNDHVHIVIG
jgi:hypothetical protein